MLEESKLLCTNLQRRYRDWVTLILFLFTPPWCFGLPLTSRAHGNPRDVLCLIVSFISAADILVVERQSRERESAREHERRKAFFLALLLFPSLARSRIPLGLTSLRFLSSQFPNSAEPRDVYLIYRSGPRLVIRSLTDLSPLEKWRLYFSRLLPSSLLFRIHQSAFTILQNPIFLSQLAFANAMCCESLLTMVQT